MIMRPTLRQLQYIIAVADTGRFGLAAEQMNVSQPSLSTQISQAEAELGLTLFNRGQAGAVITPEGKDILRRARLILREVEDLRAAAKGGSIFDGRLRLGVLPTVGPYLLPDAVRELHRDHPSFRLVVREESTQDLAEGLRSGRLDMVISTPEDFQAGLKTHLFQERLWLGVAKDDPLANSTQPIKPEDIGNKVFLTLGIRHRLAHIVAGLAAKAGGTVSDEYEGTSLDAIRIMAAAGVGVAILPQIYAMTEASRGTDIFLRPISGPEATRNISLIQPQNVEPLRGTEILAGVLLRVGQRLTNAQPVEHRRD